MSQEELRDLLHRVVPEAPEPLPGPLVAAGRRSRSRRRLGVVMGAAVAVAVVATTTVVLGGSDPEPRPDVVATPTPEPTRTTPPTTTEPYDANVCPETIPASFDNPRAIDVTSVVAITYCSTMLDGPGPPEPLTPEAFVDDMGVFAQAARSAVLTRRTCMVLSYRPPGAVVFRMADGESVAVSADCDTVRIAGERLVTLGLSTVFQDALDMQRDRLDYRSSIVATTCDDPASAGPVRPSREDLVAAVYCTADDEPSLDPAQLTALRAAWDSAAPIPDTDVGDCFSAGDTGANLRATTDRGDTVTLAVSSCGYLVLDSAPLGPLRLDVTPDQLGLT